MRVQLNALLLQAMPRAACESSNNLPLGAEVGSMPLKADYAASTTSAAQPWPSAAAAPSADTLAQLAPPSPRDRGGSDRTMWNKLCSN